MSTEETLIYKFYTSFQNKDYKGMQECYASDASFSDPVFQNLNVMELMAMWHMLCLSGKDLQLKFDSVQASELAGSCNWKAEYTFSLTKRKVINRIHAEFEFKEGKICRHKDQFSFWHWARHAFGITGILLGWSPYLRKKVRKASRKRLDDFISRHKEYSTMN